MSQELEIVQTSPSEESNFELGAWMGRRQAFSAMAGKCSAADAECLRRVRGGGLYKSRAASWEEFCTRHLGISRGYADKLIRRLEEFGPAYFHLSGCMRLSPQAYRQVSGAVSQEGIAFGGEIIPLTPENGQRIVQAVNELRQRTAESTAAEKAAPPRPASTRQRIVRAARSLDGALAQLMSLYDSALEPAEREELDQMVAGSRVKLLVYDLTSRFE